MATRVKLLLRIGLAFTFAYAGVSSLIDPASWIGFVPVWVSVIVSAEIFLLLHAIFEIAIAAAILFNIKMKYVAALAALDMLAILVFSGIDLVTFRDVGLFFVAFALWLDSSKG